MNTLLYQTATHTIQQYHMIVPDDTVLVGLSGGADSVALLHLLHRLQKQLGFTLCAAHVNHQIRAEADQDQQFVLSLCEQLHIPCHLTAAPVSALAKTWGVGEEEAGRRVRYTFFNSIAGVTKIATAHNGDDNAETVLMHLIQGTGTLGLKGIPPVRDNIIRPLLHCSRKDVEQYCQTHRLAFVTDSTNFQDDYTRNRVRHHILPLCKQENPRFIQAVARQTEHLQEDVEYLTQQGQQLIKESQLPQGYSVAVLQAAHPVVRSYGIGLLLAQHTKARPGKVHRKQLLYLLNKGVGDCSLPGITAHVAQGVLTFESQPPASQPVEVEIHQFDTPYIVGNRQITLKTCSYSQNEQKNVYNLLTYMGQNGDTLQLPLLLRNRKAGDTISLPGGCTKTLKKVMNERKIPSAKRAGCLVLCHASDIIWVEGVGCSENFKPSANHQSVIAIEIQTLQE